MVLSSASNSNYIILTPNRTSNNTHQQRIKNNKYEVNNIDKKVFNNTFKHYLCLPSEERERYYTKHIHKDILAIIHNVLYHFRFDEVQLTHEDVSADLLLHFVYKSDRIEQFTGNHYNALFTLFRNKVYDILRSHKGKQKRLCKLLELRNDYNYLLYKGYNAEDIEDQIDGDCDGE